MAHAIDRLLATPMIRPCVPESSDMSDGSNIVRGEPVELPTPGRRRSCSSFDRLRTNGAGIIEEISCRRGRGRRAEVPVRCREETVPADRRRADGVRGL